MKRTNKTAIALATAGALGFGIVPMAGAQPTTTTYETQRAADSTNDATTEIFDTDSANPKTGPAESYVEGNDPAANRPEAALVVETTVEGTPSTTTRTAEAGETFPHGHVITKKEGDKTLVLFEDENKAQFYLETNANGEPVRNGKVVEGLRPASVERKPGETTEKDALPVVLGVLGGLAGLGLVIAGVNYWVNKDGNLVTDPDKVNEPSKPEDAANTEKIVGENVDEVAQQVGIDPATGQPVDGGERGIGASTGVNKIPAALLSLLLASVLGAAAFVFGRRQLV
ncbi:hypothetical protein [Corynebacterium sp. Marseille-P4321]|uniref:hypothetical protein n=1 Tax=Corynebacterium sp. Marseille-P4321 TaxID=2736603 RepID=UPI001589CA3B|nr:hypothetical protein [Corynebacterium sp. Marseille-P4321]